MNRVLVTGANRGLGLEFVRQLLARGDRVVATCRNPGKATELNRLVGEYPNRLHVLPLELDQARSRAELVRELPLVFDRIDWLINNAGVLPSGERFGELSEETVESSLRINAVGPLLLTQALAPLIDDGGMVINLSSRMGAMSETHEFRSPSYGMGKAALNMATVQLAHALRVRSVCVIALTPGWVRTDMGGANAALAPEDSVAGMLAVADGSGIEQSGSFRDWQGQAVAW